MLRYKTETRPGLVALYDIRPGNGAGQFHWKWYHSIDWLWFHMRSLVTLSLKRTVFEIFDL